MPISSIGALPLPVPVPGANEAVSDPALDAVGSFLKAVVNAKAAAAWAAVAPPPPAQTALPVRNVFTHDPGEVFFSETHLPALYLMRERGQTERIADDFLVQSDTIAILWVFPAYSQLKQKTRHPFVSAISKILASALLAGRDPAWAVLGDPDPNAARWGSLVWDWAGLFKVDPPTWRRQPVHVQVEGNDPQSVAYQAVQVELPVQELVVDGGDPPGRTTVTIQSTDVPPVVLEQLSLIAPSP